MATLEILCYIALTGFLNVVCFLIGARTGQKAVKGEEITLPSINPIEAVKSYEERRQAEIEEENYNIMLENIESYNGTGLGQRDLK